MLVSGSEAAAGLWPIFDAAIIGSGAGGAFVAKELSEDNWNVLLLEEGDYHPTENHRDLASHSLSRLYRNGAFTFAVGNPGFPILQGRALGGTTVVNGGTCFRTPESVHKRWAEELGLGPDFSQDVFEEYYCAVEEELHVQAASFSVMSQANLLMQSSLQAAGYQSAPLKRNIKDCKGCGMCCYGCTSAAKQSMDVSIIPKAIRAGLTVFHGAEVTQISLSNSRTKPSEVFIRTEEAKFRIQAKLVVVSAGTIHTPCLLKKSRLRLSPQVGRNLVVHPAGKVYAEFEQELNSWQGTPQAIYSTALEEHGIKLEGIFVPPDIGAAMSPLDGPDLHTFMKRYSRMASFGFMIRDSSSGSVTPLPWLGPHIRYDMTQDDANRFQLATAFLAERFLEIGAKAVFPMTQSKVKQISSLEDLKAFRSLKLAPRQLEVAAFHPLGTARLGQSIKDSVVDQNLKLHGYESCYVCDGSVIPTPLGVNPQITIMAFAVRLGRHLRSLK